MRADGALSSNRVDGIFNQLRGGGGGGGERGRGRGELAERDEGAVLDPFQALPAHVERRRRGQLLGRVVQEGAPRDLQQVGHGCCGEVVSWATCAKQTVPQRLRTCWHTPRCD